MNKNAPKLCCSRCFFVVLCVKGTFEYENTCEFDIEYVTEQNAREARQREHTLYRIGALQAILTFASQLEHVLSLCALGDATQRSSSRGTII